MLFCLKEHNSVVFISCADTVKFRLSVLCSSYPGPFDSWSLLSVLLPAVLLEHLFPLHQRSFQRASTYPWPPVNGFSYTQPLWLSSARSAGTLTRDGPHMPHPAARESPALVPPGLCAGWIPPLWTDLRTGHPHTCLWHTLTARREGSQASDMQLQAGLQTSNPLLAILVSPWHPGTGKSVIDIAPMMLPAPRPSAWQGSLGSPPRSLPGLPWGSQLLNIWRQQLVFT